MPALPPSHLEAYVRAINSVVDSIPGMTQEKAVAAMVPSELQGETLRYFEGIRTVEFKPAHMVEDHDRVHQVWLPDVDRANWYYWKRLREFLIDKKGWLIPVVRSIDDSTDRILGALENPQGGLEFNTRGLVVGYVQSGKTANYSALISKAADAGYRLFIVLTGIHNSLRQQTQRRLAKELTGTAPEGEISVGRPLPDREWYTFTTDDLRFGDFNPGHGSATALASANPILIVTKKNYTVLEKLIRWLDQAQQETRDKIPCLVIDDEADQASPNTGGNRSPADVKGEITELTENDKPSTINLQIRRILSKFKKVAYVGYTATPFANVLIDPDTEDKEGYKDLYPRSFVVSLQKPFDYFGAEELFGTAESGDGMDLIRHIPEDQASRIGPRKRNEIATYVPVLPPKLLEAVDDFILAGAARAQRGEGEKPATMLIHPTQATEVQQRLTPLVDDLVGKLRDSWRYSREKGMLDRLRQRWETEFRRVTRSIQADRDVPFDDIVPHIGRFLEDVVVRQLNYGSEDELDYERDKSIKVIVIGGNKLSRGLTLEGLLVSFYVRSANAYDTLMQMGRWFGYRPGYVDLTRIYTTEQLAKWFSHLARVEQEIRDEIARYELERKTPLDLTIKIRTHPAMMVTSPAKMKKAQTVRISYEDQLVQTTSFPLNPPEFEWFRDNLAITKDFLSSLGPPHEVVKGRPLWRNVSADQVRDFLAKYRTHEGNSTVRADLLSDYVRRQNAYGELVRFTVGVVGQEKEQPELGADSLGILGGTSVNLIERSRLIKDLSSLKAIGSQDDQRLGLNEEQTQQAEGIGTADGHGYRVVRGKEEGLFLIYPISRNSGWKYRGKSRVENTRCELFADLDQSEHVVGIAFSFPPSKSGATGEYVAVPLSVDEE